MLRRNVIKLISTGHVTFFIILVMFGFLSWCIFSGLVFDRLDERKFSILDSNMKSLYEKLKNNSNNDIWKYKAVCSVNRTGWMATGDYSCVTSISIQKKVSSVNDFNNLFADYFKTIDKSDYLNQSSNLVKNTESDFGKSFVVSSASKNYKELKSGIGCEYLIKLYQSDESVGLLYDSYGSTIVGDTGNAFVSLRCADTARNNWYPLSDTGDLIIP